MKRKVLITLFLAAVGAAVGLFTLRKPPAKLHAIEQASDPQPVGAVTPEIIPDASLPDAQAPVVAAKPDVRPARRPARRPITASPTTRPATDEERRWADWEARVRAVVPPEKVAAVMQVYRDYCANDENFTKVLVDETAPKWGELRAKGPVVIRDKDGQIVGPTPAAKEFLNKMAKDHDIFASWNALLREKRARLAELVPIEPLEAIDHDFLQDTCSNAPHD